MRRRFPYILATTDFIVFNLVITGVMLLQPEAASVFGQSLPVYLLPFLVSTFMVALQGIFRQYRFRQRDRFLRQFMGAYNVITLGFLLLVILGFDLAGVMAAKRGMLLLLFTGLIGATTISRIIIYIWMGRKVDFSLKEPLVLRNDRRLVTGIDQPPILPSSMTVGEVRKRLENSNHDFAVLTDAKGYYDGTIVDGDILEATLQDSSGTDRPIAEIMNRQYPVAREILSPGQIHQTMVERNLRFLPLLTNEGKPSQIVLLSDLEEKYRLSKKKTGSGRKVLIIGGAGFIGSIMTRYMLKKGYSVSVLDNLTFGYTPLEGLDNHPAYRFYRGDCRNIQDLLTALNGVDTVIHLAAIVGDPACALDPRATIEINYEASKLLVDACLQKNVERLLFASSCSVYGASEGNQLLNEQSPLNPVSLYAETRLKSEEAILKQAKSPLAVAMLRLSTVFGFSYRPRFDLVVNTLTARALQDGEISIFGGSQWRPNVHALDVVRAFVAATEAPNNVIDRETFNVGSESQNYRIEQLGEMVKEALPETVVKTVNAEMDRRDYRVSFDKIESMLDYRAIYTVQDGIREIIDAFKQDKFGHYSLPIYSNVKYFSEVK